MILPYPARGPLGPPGVAALLRYYSSEDSTPAETIWDRWDDDDFSRRDLLALAEESAPKAPTSRRVMISLQWDGTNREAVRLLFSTYWFFTSRRSKRKVKESVVSVYADQDDTDGWAFPGEWILIMEDDSVEIVSDWSFKRLKKKGELVFPNDD